MVTIKFLGGRIADSRELEDSASARFLVLSGPYRESEVVVSTYKANCGAYGAILVAEDSNGWTQSSYEWCSGGCHTHPAIAIGDEDLGEVLAECLRFSREEYESALNMQERLKERRRIEERLTEEAAFQYEFSPLRQAFRAKGF